MSAPAQVQTIQRDADSLTYSGSTVTLYGRHNLFDLCADDAIMSFSLQGRNSPLIDWIGVVNSNVYQLEEIFLSYADASGTAAGTPAAAWQADPCAPGNTVEWATCDFRIQGFGRYRMASPVRDLTDDTLRYCEKQPVYRVDGTPITDELEWDYWKVGAGLAHALSRAIITGNKSTAGQFDGLARLIKYGYTNISGNACPAMDSIVVDWDGNVVSPASPIATGVTVNGAAYANAVGLLDTLRWVIRRIQHRIASSGLGGAINPGDIALVMPFEFINCLLDAWTCYTICGGDITRLMSYEARAFRQSLNGGPFSTGKLLGFEGLDIPIIPHDYGMINSDGTFNMYLLVRAIGGQPVLEIQVQDMTDAVARNPYYTMTDGNRFLSWVNRDNTCRQLQVEIKPRLVLRAPWAQASFLNVQCSGIPNVISSDPQSTLFFAKTGDLHAD